uniref:Uncharacterized protein n=1 Tax=Salix viminalis TaxID=40686 RepID=A0A6N2LSD9_SALVM
MPRTITSYRRIPGCVNLPNHGLRFNIFWKICFRHTCMGKIFCFLPQQMSGGAGKIQGTRTSCSEEGIF